MLFNSAIFGIFLAVFLVGWALLPKSARRLWLLGGSWLFYASWEPVFLLLLMFSTALDYRIGLWLESETDERRRKVGLAASLVGNLGLLLVFKYGDFILGNLGLSDGALRSQSFHIDGAIPPGISFYTFQTLSYTIDVYRRKTKACRSFIDFSVYVAFFPQLIAGPIVRAHEFMPQLAALKKPTRRQVIQGAELFALGLFKKVIIADNIGALIDPVFEGVGGYTAHTLALAAALFSAQVYCDFSGYSTMARGLASMLGFSLPRNFNYPWLASSPTGYRRGWHMTMSNWFRDYVFRPLGGTRRGKLRVAGNLMLVWALFGLWHGASWSFVLWGVYNGLVQVIYRTFVVPQKIPDFPGKALMGWAITMSLLIPSALFFRTGSASDGLLALRRVTTWSTAGEQFLEPMWWIPASLLLAHAAARQWYDEDLLARLPWTGRVVLLGALAAVVIVAAPEQRPFIYFQF
ncbi:MAG: alginate O-acetyltransferase complex protein AlgI [Myxococcota bacterium]|jgi:alginate O-acetyltransferase complex protein AlgI